VLKALQPDPRVEETGMISQCIRTGQDGGGAAEQGMHHRNVEGKSSVQDDIGAAFERQDAEQFAGTHVVPVEQRENGTGVAMTIVSEHATQQAHIGVQDDSPRAAVPLIQRVAGVHKDAKLRIAIETLSQGRIQSMQAIQQQHLIFLQSNGLGAHPTAFLETEDGFLNGSSLQQRS